MLKASTLQLLRIPFSFFLMPVYWFALSEAPGINVTRAVAIFIILHLLLYPAANAYNSYMDRDTGSIGMVRRPLPPTPQLFYASVLLDAVALIAGFFISLYFAGCTAAFILASHAYSYCGIRLKKYPVTGYLTAIFFQGGLVYFMAFHGSSATLTSEAGLLPLMASTLLVGSFYPLTQIYQHKQDKADGIRTLSMLLGYRGTFIFSACTCCAALLILGYYFTANLESERFLVVIGCMLPVMICFIRWFAKVWKDPSTADYQSSLRMNMVTAVCLNTAFIILLMLN